MNDALQLLIGISVFAFSVLAGVALVVRAAYTEPKQKNHKAPLLIDKINIE